MKSLTRLTIKKYIILIIFYYFNRKSKQFLFKLYKHIQNVLLFFFSLQLVSFIIRQFIMTWFLLYLKIIIDWFLWMWVAPWPLTQAVNICFIRTALQILVCRLISPAPLKLFSKSCLTCRDGWQVLCKPLGHVA